GASATAAANPAHGSATDAASGASAALAGDTAPGSATDAAFATNSAAETSAGAVYALVVSGKTEAAVRGNSARLAAHLASGAVALGDVALSLATTRTAFATRAAVVAQSATEAIEALTAVAEGRSHGQVVSGTVVGGELGILFTGQGSQRVGMGRGLYAAQPAFRRALDEVCAALDAHLEVPV